MVESYFLKKSFLSHTLARKNDLVLGLRSNPPPAELDGKVNRSWS